MAQRVLAPFGLGQGMLIQINSFRQTKWMMIMLIYFAITFATQLLAPVQVTIRGPHCCEPCPYLRPGFMLDQPASLL